MKTDVEIHRINAIVKKFERHVIRALHYFDNGESFFANVEINEARFCKALLNAIFLTRSISDRCWK